MPTNPERHGILVSAPAPLLYPINALPLVRQAVLVAEAELLRGVKEDPPGSNSGPDVREYQVGLYGDGAGYLEREKWCARFVRYVYERAAQELDLPRPFKGWRRSFEERHDSDLASATKWFETARYLAKVIPPNEQRFGDVGLFLNPNHVVLIVGKRGHMTITIEGNFRNRVAMVLRDPKEFYAVVRVIS